MSAPVLFLPSRRIADVTRAACALADRERELVGVSVVVSLDVDEHTRRIGPDFVEAGRPAFSPVNFENIYDEFKVAGETDSATTLP